MKKSQLVLTVAGIATLLSAGIASAQDLYVSDTGGDQITVVQPGGASQNYGNSSDLSDPTGVAYYGGDVYIADSTTGDITEFNTNTQTFSQFYNGGGLSDPQGIAFDSSGDLFVANSGANNIMEFTAGSKTPMIYTTLAAGAAPSDLTIDGNGNLYITESGANKIVESVAAFAGATTGFYPPKTGSNPALSTPEGITFGPNGVYVANMTGMNGNTVYYVSLQPQGSVSISNASPNPGNLDKPIGDVFGANGYLYVVDNGSNQVTEYVRGSGNDGTYVYLGTFGTGYNNPSFATFGPGPSVPEPSTYVLLLGGIVALYYYQRRRTAVPVKI